MIPRPSSSKKGQRFSSSYTQFPYEKPTSIDRIHTNNRANLESSFNPKIALVKNENFPQLTDSQFTRAKPRLTLNLSKTEFQKEHPSMKKSRTMASFNDSEIGNKRTNGNSSSVGKSSELTHSFPRNKNIPKMINLPLAKSAYFQFFNRTAIYSVNTTNGLIRNYNEDRVSIVINIKKKANWNPKKRWPVCSFFSIFDGHGGPLCSEFLMENLHKYILESNHFPEDIPSAIHEGCELAEQNFKKLALSKTPMDKSGSCALVLILTDNKAFIGNIGDSRAIISQNRHKTIQNLSRDHKPDDSSENARIAKAGGLVSKSLVVKNMPIPTSLNIKMNDLPFRVYPGGLSVSRSIGDLFAKEPSKGGNPNVLIAKPEITSFDIDIKTDFILMACDGVFDKVGSEELGRYMGGWVGAWSEARGGLSSEGARLKKAEEVVDNVILEAVRRQSFDNLTAILINFNSF